MASKRNGHSREDEQNAERNNHFNEREARFPALSSRVRARLLPAIPGRVQTLYFEELHTSTTAVVSAPADSGPAGSALKAGALYRSDQDAAFEELARWQAEEQLRAVSRPVRASLAREKAEIPDRPARSQALLAVSLVRPAA
jgi:hypothetical protein